MMITNKIETLAVKGARYIDAYRISIVFNDGMIRVVDFKPFLQRHKNGYLKKYSIPSNFKNFHIEDGNLVWGKTWDLVFPVRQLHNREITL